MEPEPKTFLASPKTMGAIMAASRNGISKERWATVHKRCKANQLRMFGSSQPCSPTGPETKASA